MFKQRKLKSTAAVAANLAILLFWTHDQTASPFRLVPGAPMMSILSDVYPDPEATFASTYGDFYHTFANKYKRKFSIEDTGVDKGASAGAKRGLSRAAFEYELECLSVSQVCDVL